MKKKSIIISAILVAIISIVSWKLVNNKKTIDSRKEVKTVLTEIAVTVVPAEMKTIDGNLKLVGTAEAERTVSVASVSAGRITRVNFKLGDFVNKGTVLAQVDDEYKRLSLETAQLNYNKFKEDYERFQVLREGDAASEIQLRDMKLGFENASIQLENAKKQWEDTRVVAPYSGYITLQNAEEGAYVNVGTAVAGIVDIAQLKITLMISENSVYTIRQGQEAIVTASVYPKATYKGKVYHISPQGDNAHTYPVEIIVPNSKEYPLKAGTYVNVQINMGQSAPSLMILREAIVSSVKEPSVYVVSDDMAKLTRIVTGRDAGSYLEVLSGLNENDLVVTNGQINLMDGAKVSIINKN